MYHATVPLEHYHSVTGIIDTTSLKNGFKLVTSLPACPAGQIWKWRGREGAGVRGWRRWRSSAPPPGSSGSTSTCTSQNLVVFSASFDFHFYFSQCVEVLVTLRWLNVYWVTPLILRHERVMLCFSRVIRLTMSQHRINDEWDSKNTQREQSKLWPI